MDDSFAGVHTGIPLHICFAVYWLPAIKLLGSCLSSDWFRLFNTSSAVSIEVLDAQFPLRVPNTIAELWDVLSIFSCKYRTKPRCLTRDDFQRSRRVFIYGVVNNVQCAC